MRRLIFISLVAAMSVALIACGGGDDDTNNGTNGTNGIDPPPVDTTGAHNTFIMDSVIIPSNQAEANEIGLNIDGDENGIPDNALGKILAALGTAAGDLNVQDSIDEQVQAGELLLLTSMQATDLVNSTGAGLWVYLGDTNSPSTTPCDGPSDTTCGKHLDGQTNFAIDASSPRDALIGGQIVSGGFSGGPGTVTLELGLVADAAPVRLELIGARAEVTVSRDGLSNGRLGGAVTDEQLQTEVLPALTGVLRASAADDCQGTPETGCCTDGTTGDQLYDLFDTNNDCDVTVEEVRESSLISTLLAPDVDLLDETGAFNPRVDGVPDSLSLGVGFSGVGATFDVPAAE